MGKKLDEFGEPDMSGAVRPMALSPDERYVYFQVSFFHGFVEYDLQQDRVLRLAHLPVSDEAKQKRRDEYLLDSAHHGLAMNPSGTKLCAAGTMSDYAAIVDRGSFAYTIAAHGPQAVLGHEQRPRQLLLRVVQRRRRRLGDLVPQGEGDRAHPGGRPPAADADGQGPRGAAGHEEAAPRSAASAATDAACRADRGVIVHRTHSAHALDRREDDLVARLARGWFRPASRRDERLPPLRLLHRRSPDPLSFIAVEEWLDDEALAAHLRQPHVARLIAAPELGDGARTATRCLERAATAAELVAVQRLGTPS